MIHITLRSDASCICCRDPLRCTPSGLVLARILSVFLGPKEDRMTKLSIVAFDRFTDIDVFMPWDLLFRAKSASTADWTIRILGKTDHVTSVAGLRIPTNDRLDVRRCCHPRREGPAEGTSRHYISDLRQAPGRLRGRSGRGRGVRPYRQCCNCRWLPRGTATLRLDCRDAYNRRTGWRRDGLDPAGRPRLQSLRRLGRSGSR